MQLKIYTMANFIKNMLPREILSYPENFSLLFNTDGVPIFKSSNYSIWPIYFIINELPYKYRMLKQNCLLGGVWFGSKKPNMQLFLRPLREALHKLEVIGVRISQFIVCKVILLAGTLDLPAKSLVTNFRQYNGFYGCSKCLQPGNTLSLGPRSHTHVYPYINNPPTRSREQTNIDVKHYLDNGTIRNGVLGPSWFGCLKYFDLVRGTAIDYMHCILLGIVRRLLGLWLDTRNHNKEYYIGHLISLLDRRLLNIKPIYKVTRAPGRFMRGSIGKPQNTDHYYCTTSYQP